MAKRTAEDVAESVSGVHDVHNQLTIQPTSQAQTGAQGVRSSQTVH
jgi:hypothetical protein